MIRQDIPYSTHVMTPKDFPGEGKYVQLCQLKCLGVIYIIHAEQMAGNVFHLKVDGAGDEGTVWETIVTHDIEYLCFRAQVRTIGIARILTERIVERHDQGLRIAKRILGHTSAFMVAEERDPQIHAHQAPQLGMYHEATYRAELPDDRDVQIIVRVREHVDGERMDS